MLDPTLERRLSDCKELVGNWKVFHEFFKLGVRGQDLTADKEARFLQIKSKIAMLHDSFIDSLSHDQNIGQNIITIVARCITLKHLHKLGPAEIKKMEIEWHESYLLLNETIAMLEEKKEAMDKINPTQYKMDRYKQLITMNVKHFLTSIYFKAALVLFGLIFVIFGIPMLGIYDYKNLRKTPVKPVYDVGAGLYRMMSSSYPYDDIEQVEFRKDILGSQFQAQNDPNADDILKNLRVVPGLQSFVDTIQSNKGTRGKFYLMNSAPIMWVDFLLEKTETAEAAVKAYNDWFNPLPTTDKNNPRHPAAKILVFNKRNCVVVMFFDPGVRSSAQTIKTDGYGIK